MLIINSKLNSRNHSVDTPCKQSKSGNTNIYLAKGLNKLVYPQSAKLYQVYFTGMPISIGAVEINNAQDAIRVYEMLKLGNYTDMHDDRISEEIRRDHKAIRAENFKFLDRLSSSEDKKRFVEYYKKLTGFPHLETVSKNIENEFRAALTKTEFELKEERPDNFDPDFFNILSAGYDNTCSVFRRKALPGSDMDKAYIIIKGTDDDKKNREIVELFKGKLWNNTDQRILSYNHDDAFPQAYTVKQIKKFLDVVEGKIKNFITDEKYSKYKAIQKVYRKGPEGYIEANPFFIELSEQFPAHGPGKQDDLDHLSKTDVKNFGFFIEAYREGKHLIDETENAHFEYMDREIRSSVFYDLTNLSQLKTVLTQNKEKITARDRLEKEFDSWTIEAQYNMVKTLIKASCDDNEPDEFPEYFAKLTDEFSPLIKILIGQGENDK